MLPYIIAAEAALWLLPLGGLSIRYLLRWRTASSVVLMLTPLVDIAIIALTYIDLGRGAPSDFGHGLAAFYVGFSVTFGPECIRRFDRLFAGRYTDLPADQLPEVPERSSTQYWLRCLVAASITIGLLAIGIAVAGFAGSFWLIYWMVSAASTAIMWGIVGPLRDRLRARRAGEQEARATAGG